MDKWIPVAERLPKERDSIFEKYYGTEKWDNAMFRKSSDNVIVTILLSDGTKVATEGVIRDGKWDIQMVRFRRKEILAWMPMPEPYKDGEHK